MANCKISRVAYTKRFYGFYARISPLARRVYSFLDFSSILRNLAAVEFFKMTSIVLSPFLVSVNFLSPHSPLIRSFLSRA